MEKSQKLSPPPPALMLNSQSNFLFAGKKKPDTTVPLASNVVTLSHKNKNVQDSNEQSNFLKLGTLLIFRIIIYRKENEIYYG